MTKFTTDSYMKAVVTSCKHKLLTKITIIINGIYIIFEKSIDKARQRSSVADPGCFIQDPEFGYRILRPE
jgi:hypothetical protein